MPFGSPPPRLVATAVVALVSSVWLSGCKKEGCVGGEDGCRVPSPCQELAFTCEDPSLELRVLGEAGGAPRPGGLDAHGAFGDVLLGNAKAVAVVAGLGHQTFLDPNGGALIDLGTRGKDNDSLNQLLTVTGILPQDAVHYTKMELIQECEGGRPCKAVQFLGTLDGQPELRVATRYEVRPCEPGVRIRTEVVNGTPDPQLWALSDGFYWSGREALPFAPAKGTGYEHPAFSLLSINSAYRSFPFLAANGYGAPSASYALTACNAKGLSGFNSGQISGVGLGQKVVPSRDYLVYERFMAVADGDDVAAGADVALEVRRQLFGEKYVTLSGTVDREGLPVGHEQEVALLISEGKASTAVTERTPWTQVVPDKDGRWSARVPAGRDYLLELRSFGRTVAEHELSAVREDEDVGTLAVRRSAHVTLRVQDAAGQKLDALVLVVAADEATAAATRGSLYGTGGACSPWLGPPQGGSPACNRFLTTANETQADELDLPAGNYFLYATKGPFWTIARQQLSLDPVDYALPFVFQLEKLGGLQPTGTVGADLHVHGAQSFDSSIPDVDRVRSFAALDLDVIAATDHEVVYDYASVVRQLGYDGRMTAIPGVETTGHVLWMKTPGASIPKVIGHYNFWPLPYDPTKPRNGGPLDELVEPGQLFAKVKELATVGEPVFQLNHPWAEPEFGRDLGFPRALAMDLRKDLPAEDDGTSNGMYVRKDVVSGLRNSDHHAQEVMNGTQNDLLLPYRAFWFYTLNQGQLRAGTANSDTHSLVDNTVGLPRNLVYADTQGGPTFDVNRFNHAVREGHLLGTNGPIIEATLKGADGAQHPFGLTPFRPSDDVALSLRVSAAPWVPVEEVRIVVNGKVVKSVTEGLEHPADPFGTSGVTRFSGTVSLAGLLPPSGDAWVVVEAGRKLLLAGDLGGGPGGVPDGVPDTTDNDGNGVVDIKDVAAGGKYGPLKNPELPADTSAAAYHFGVVVSDGYPMSFTNPFILDRDGNGRFDAPGVKGGF